MSTPPPTDRAARVRERVAARARRAANLRRGAVAGALATFALAWGVIAFHGPLGVDATTTASTGTTTSATSTSSTPTSTSTSTDNATSSDNTVTTAQS